MKALSKIKWIMILLLLAYFTNSIKAQTNFVWGKQFGTDKEEASLNIVADDSGNVYIAGSTKGVFSGQNYGKTDGFITKLDSSGNIIWTKQFGTEKDDNILDLKIDKAGSLYATGSTKGDFNEKNFGRNDIMVVKLDNAGNIQWQKQFGTDSLDIGNAIYVDTQGDIYVAGVTMGKLGKSSFGKPDCFILKLDNEGNKLFAYQFGTSEDEGCQGITGDDQSHIYVCGISSGDLAAKNKGKFDAFIGIFNNKGDEIKLLQFGTDSMEIANKLIVDKEKNIYVGGSTVGDLGGKNQGQGDAFLTKINANMDIIWTRQFGDPLHDSILGIDLNEQKSDNIVVSGCQNWPSCKSFIRMYKKDGTLVSVNNYVASGKKGGTCGKGVCFDNKGNIYHTGLTGGNLFNSNLGEHDIFVIKQELDISQTNH